MGRYSESLRSAVAAHGLPNLAYALSFMVGSVAGYALVGTLAFEQNAGAVRLYEREGFEAVGRTAVALREKIHHTGDVLLMVAEISSRRSAGASSF